MGRPSDALLRWLRAKLDARGLHTAALAEKLGRPRPEVRKLLSGAEPMLVDDMLRITELLDLTAEDVGLPVGVDPDALNQIIEADTVEPVHWRNQPMALLKFGFRLGVDFMFLVDTSQLGDWGGPESVLAQHRGKELPLRLDAAYHAYMAPEFGEQAFSVVLSFDKLYRCTFPWPAIVRVIFLPFPPEMPAPEPVKPEEAPAKGPPRLRLVT